MNETMRAQLAAEYERRVAEIRPPAVAAAASPAGATAQPVPVRKPRPPLDHPGHESGASLRTYLIIGVVLAVFTAIEVQVPGWMAGDRPLMVSTLLVLAFVKAAFVIMYYMHLRFDTRVYSGIIALAVVLIAYFLWLITGAGL